MHIPPGAVPFAEVTPDLVARSEDVHVFDEEDPGFGVSIRVAAGPRGEHDTLRVLMVVADHEFRDLQVAFLRTVVMSASRPPAPAD